MTQIAISPPLFSIAVRVYFQDTDSGGVVYHANYLGYMDRCRTEWVRALGWDQIELARAFGGLVVVRGAQMRMRAPARLDDLLTVSISGVEMRRASGKVFQAVHRGDLLLCDGVVDVAWVDRDTFKPGPLPTQLLEKMQAQ